MTATTTEPRRQFQQLIPQLVDAYSMIPFQEESWPLAEQANQLTPVYQSLSARLSGEIPATNFSLTTSHNELVRSFNDCTTFFADRQRDVREFAELVCCHAVQIQVKGQSSPQARAAALESARRPLLTAIKRITKPLPALLTAELIAQPLPIVQSRTGDWVREACETIAAQLLMSLHVLVEMDVVGIIEWPGDTACKLHYYRHVVKQDRIQSKTTERSRIRTNDDSTRQLTVEQWEQMKGRNTFSIERHEHHVMNAEARETTQTKLPIPQDHDQFLQRIPAWIRKHIRVLEGDLILEKVVTTEVRKESFQSKPIRRSVNEETLPAVRPTLEFDPAILLGHYVLTGWTQREIEKEKHRRSQLPKTPHAPQVVDHRRAAGRNYGALAPYATAGVIGSGMMMFWSRLQPTMMVPMSLLIAVGSIVATGFCFNHYSRWKRGSADSILVLAGTSAIALWLLAALCLCCGFLYGRTSLIPIAIVVGLAARPVWRVAMERDRE
ncbi:MAG TPA: hypothetical protein PLY87_17410 [Planctomycetaceae bacterium]|nr:hypothetical protein [Planctomycetaceae bacterium]HQZ66876.1 hypothetical protein [Planctomycetaceae bacterium]